MADAWIEQRRQQIRERMRREPGYAPIGVAELRDLGVDIAGNKLQTYEQAAGKRVPGGLPQEGFLPPRPSIFEGDYPPGWSQQGTELQDALARRARRFTEDPGFGKETEAERAARRAAQDAAYQQSLTPPGPPPPFGERPSTIPGPPEPFAGTFPPRPEGLAGGLPGQPPPPFNMVRPEGSPGGLPGQQSAQSLADIFGAGGAGPPDPFAGVGRPEGPPAGMPPMTPNMPRPRPMDSMIAGRPEMPGGLPAAPSFAGNMPQPRQTGALGSGERSLTPGLPHQRPPEFGPYERPAQLADLRNGPRDISPGLMAGGQEARLPIPRPGLPTDVAAQPPIPSPGAAMAALPNAQPAPAAFAPAGQPTGQNRLTPDMDAAGPPPPFGTMIAPAIDPTQAATRGLPQQVPPDRGTVLAREEAKRTLQLHPDTGRIPTAPGLQQFNEPARQPVGPQGPVGIRDLEAERASPEVMARVKAEAAANPARLPRPRPAMEAMGSDVPPQSYTPFTPAPAPRSGPIMRADSGLPDTAMAGIRSSYDPTAMGGPITPETPEEVVARKALLARRGTPPDVVEGYAEEEDLIAKPAVGAINEGQPLPPPPVPAVEPPPSITQQRTIDGPPDPLAAAGLQYQGPTAQSRFGGNIFQRIGTPHERHIGGPGLMGPLDPLRQQNYVVNKDKTERGERKSKYGSGVGKYAGATLGAVLGSPGGVVGMGLGGKLGWNAGRWLGGGIGDPNIGFGSRWGLRGGGKKKSKKEEALERMEAMQREQQRRDSVSSGGLGSDRGGGGMGGIFGGGTFGGYGMGGGYGGSGGRYINEGVGGAYRNR